MANDKMPDGFYHAHSDDMQGLELAQLKDGRVIWFQSVQGMVLIYEVKGWEKLRRRSGKILRADRVKVAERKGKGLRGVYFHDEDRKRIAFEVVEAPIYFNRFGKPPHAKMPKAPHWIVWEGRIEAPFSDEYQFESLHAKDEKIIIEIEGKVVYQSGTKQDCQHRLRLRTGQMSRIRIQYFNGKDRPELKLFWKSTLFDRQLIPKFLLYSSMDAGRH